MTHKHPTHRGEETLSETPSAPLAPHELVVAALPGGGWQAEFETGEKLTERSPIVAWLVHADGDLEPAILDRAGVAEDPREIVNFTGLIPPTTATSAPETGPR